MANSPAERGPSGTGHDGEGMPTDREWLEGLACQSSYPHEAHGSCPGLRRPSDPPVAVPGPASEPRHVLVIRFGERRNAEQARRQIVWAMERANLVPFDIELEEVDRGY